MKARTLWLSILSISLTSPLFAGEALQFDPDELARYDLPIGPERERCDSSFAEEPLSETAQNLSPFFEEFTADGTVSIYLGYGMEAYNGARLNNLAGALKSIARQNRLTLTNFTVDAKDWTIDFGVSGRTAKYHIEVGHTREAYIKALASSEVVLYHGHSRYGRGPAFDSFQNYFRMGDVFKAIEIDARSQLFPEEPTMLTEEFPPQTATIDNQTIEYQYRGAKVSSSELPKDSYTRNIEGLDKDLRSAEFLATRQLLFFHSCRNVYYWRKPLRALHPDAGQKFAFGTRENSGWNTGPAAVMIMSVVRQVSSPQSIINGLNATRDCGKNCFVAY